LFCAEDAALLAQGKDDKQKKCENNPKDVNICSCRQPLKALFDETARRSPNLEKKETERV
jgi:hypothetical protein